MYMDGCAISRRRRVAICWFSRYITVVGFLRFPNLPLETNSLSCMCNYLSLLHREATTSHTTTASSSFPPVKMRQFLLQIRT